VYVCVSLKNFATTVHRLSRHHFTTSLSLLAFSSTITHLTLRSPVFSMSFGNAQNNKIVGQDSTKRTARTREFHAPRRPIRHYLLRSRLDENSARSDPSAAASSSYIVRAEPFPAHSRNGYVPSLSNR